MLDLIQKKIKKGFRARTFKQQSDLSNFLLSDNITLLLEEKCCWCSRDNFAKEICDGYKNKDDELESSCFYCGKPIYPKLKIRVGRNLGIPFLDSCREEETLFYNEQGTKCIVQNLLNHKQEKILYDDEYRIDLSVLREHYKNVLWNCLFHFRYY